MAANFLIVGFQDIHVDENGQFVGVRLEDDTSQTVGLGLHPEMTHQLALSLLKALSDATKSGKLASRLSPMMKATTQMEATDSGVELSFDLSDGLRIVSEMPWASARDFALCDLGTLKPSDLN